ncbi:MAG: YggS family pyridoxal phosphate-dependent enzyme [Pseudomonadota bacterium]
MSHDLKNRLAAVSQRIADSCHGAHRKPETVQLIAVSKRHSIEKIRDLRTLGQQHFAENYLQEALEKIGQIENTGDDTDPVFWHFIGHIQSRKCRELATHFDWAHTVCSQKVADKLNQFRAEASADQVLNVLIQVNLQGEENKSGLPPSEVHRLAKHIESECPALSLRGLMIIPQIETDVNRQRIVFGQLRSLLNEVADYAEHADQLSMGMTADLEAAILEGSTMVRIGTALFGERPN